MTSPKRKLGFITQPDTLIESMFKKWGYDMTHNLSHLDSAQFVVFPGGEDVSPFLYGHKRSINCGHTSIERDLRENKIFRIVDPGIPKFGICRGAQFLNVMNGGQMYQHVNNHGGDHMVRLFFNDKLEPVKDYHTISVTSTHHQMMIPSLSHENIVIGMASRATEKWYENRKIDFVADGKTYKDTEIVYYNDSNSLCFQPHPEYCQTDTHPCKVFFKNLFDHIMTESYQEETNE